MHDPELLILDEPTSGLDPLMQQMFLEMVAEARDAGQTMFMSSHIMSEVEAVADRVAIIRQGRLVATGDRRRLRARSSLRVRIGFAAPVRDAEFAALPGASGPARAFSRSMFTRTLFDNRPARHGVRRLLPAGQHGRGR
ncbi:hypothetical protein ACFQY7_07740 [Actinomadura luteofluorescens]|uniref:hypothetical protein n=1 Tax=Actinomadura luteofluorescens TaxID=46163 RepID=UPI0036437AC0